LVELVQQGLQRLVTSEGTTPGASAKSVDEKDDRTATFRSMLVAFRREESRIQMQAMYKGLCKIVPAEILRIFTWEELRSEVCGVPDVSVERLRDMAVYKNFSKSDETVKFLWDVLEHDFTPEQRIKFLEYVWARARLPSSSSIMRPFNIVKMDCNTPDTHLPSARTCFFEISLPQYTSRDVMRQKLAYAIDLKGMSDHDVS
jgi:hypothetical protein